VVLKVSLDSCLPIGESISMLYVPSTDIIVAPYSLI
jgi:hypothetical protein